MGCGGSMPISEETKEIDAQLKKQAQRMQREIKLLLLGSGASGKSTIAKQMKVMFLDGFSEKERMLFVEFIHLNILNALKLITRTMTDKQVEPEDKDALEVFETLKMMTPHHGNMESVTPDFGRQLKHFWLDPEVQNTWKMYSDARGDESAKYFLDDLDRCACSENFVPTLDDVLHVRIKTTGIKELNFAHEGFTFRVVDVGGQKSERRKWIHCFQDVTAVIFVSSLNDFNLALEEDPSINRMVDSLDLFSKVSSNNKWFEKVNIILFLNKNDLFQAKIEHVKVSDYFPEFKEENNGKSKEAIEFFTEKFRQVSGQRTLHSHVTSATDKDNVEKVWKSVHNILVNSMIDSFAV